MTRAQGLEKYKISSDYLKNWPLLKLFDFVKVFRNTNISNLKTTAIKCFFLIFSDVTFHIETFSTNITFTSLTICLFIWKRHLGQCNVKSVENISRRNKNNQTRLKKTLDFFCSCLEISIFQTSF